MMAFIDQGVAFVIGVVLASLVWGCLALWSMRPEQETPRRTGGRRWSDQEDQQLVMAECVGLDLVRHLERQSDWSRRTFGPGNRTQALIDHIRKELAEIEARPFDLYEWIDVVMLGLDGAWRAGFEPEDIAGALEIKLELNESRVWPDWRTADPDKAIEHVRQEVTNG